MVQFLASNIVMTDTMVKQINRLIYRFVWKGPDKIKREVASKSHERGGLKLPGAGDIANAASVQWLARAIKWPDRPWADFIHKDLDRLGGVTILNSKGLRKLDLSQLLDFNTYIIKAWWDILSAAYSQ